MFNFTDDTSEMTKSKAVALFKRGGYIIGSNVTFASKNKSAETYWANPKFEILRNNWYLILNDSVHHNLFLFFIPAKTLSESNLLERSDKKEVADIQIDYNDSKFTDKRSKIQFIQFLKHTVQY